MNLVIDIGNTLSKLALFKGNELIEFSSTEKLDVAFLQSLVEKKSGIKSAILSSVISHPVDINVFLKKQFHFIELNTSTKLPLKNCYKTPETLGKDRLAVAVGANQLFRNTNVLAIDAGTCIKYDFVNDKNEYLGGGISPGIDIRFKALHTFTDKLPLLSFQQFEKLVGENTNESILSGVVNGAVHEVKGIITEYEKQFPNLKVLFTGGYSGFFEKQLKNTIFADLFLVLKGLNVILNFNVQGSQ
jgi:type III pantothenate kinase